MELGCYIQCITVFESDGPAYAAVTAHFDNGVQILNVTDPDLPAQDLEIVSGMGDIGYTAGVSGGTLAFGATIPGDPQEIPHDRRFIFYLTVADGHEPPGTASLSVVLYLPEAGESAWPDCWAAGVGGPRPAPATSRAKTRGGPGRAGERKARPVPPRAGPPAGAAPGAGQFLVETRTRLCPQPLSLAIPNTNQWTNSVS